MQVVYLICFLPWLTKNQRYRDKNQMSSLCQYSEFEKPLTDHIVEQLQFNSLNLVEQETKKVLRPVV